MLATKTAFTASGVVVVKSFQLGAGWEDQVNSEGTGKGYPSGAGSDHFINSAPILCIL